MDAAKQINVNPIMSRHVSYALTLISNNELVIMKSIFNMITQILKLLDTHSWYILIAQKYFNISNISKYRKIEL